MSSEVALVDRLVPTFAASDRSVLEWVDELLAASPRCDLALDWQEGVCRLTLVAEGSTERREIAMRKSVFRAVLARVAAICNEQTPGAVSPYGGAGQLQMPGDPTLLIDFSFTNTPGVQGLKLACRQVGHDNARDRVATAGSA